MGVLLEYAYYRIVSPVKLPEYVLTPGELCLRKARREFDNLIYGIIAKRKQHPSHYNDLLGMLPASIDEDTNTGGMTEEQLRDEIITLFMAGHEKSAHALCGNSTCWHKAPKRRYVCVKRLHALRADNLFVLSTSAS